MNEHDANTGTSTGIGALQEEITTFVQQGREVGKFWYDEEKGQFMFKGDVKESAEIFMLEILRQLNESNKSPPPLDNPKKGE